MGIGFRQFGHRRLMGKPTGTQEQHAFIESAGETSNGFTQHAGTLETGQRRGDTVDEHRQNWHLIQPTEQELQRLGEPVVHLHTVRNGKIDPLFMTACAQASASSTGTGSSPAALPKSPIAVAPTPKQNGGITS
ncbi:hypothetical protein ECZU27_11530 [Escherichia coli]|nr:hypothetical protein ECZU27_11530 [Escherichia coli]